MNWNLRKRVGPVPIALVAVLALAAFISAGLWLVPNNGAQAQDTPAVTANSKALTDTTVDVGEAFEVATSSLFDNLPDGAVVASFAATAVDDSDGDTTEEAFTLTLADGTLTFSATDIAAALGETDGTPNTVGTTTAITVAYDVDGGAEPPPVNARTFRITVVQDPTEVSGIKAITPDGSTTVAGYDPFPGGACSVSTADAATEGVTSRGLTVTNTPTDHDGDGGTAAVPVSLVSGGKCIATGDTVSVSFENTDADDDAQHLVYVTGGDDLTNSRFKPVLAKAGLDEHMITVPDEDLGDAGKTTITVNRNQAKNGVVYVLGYFTPDRTPANNLDKDSTTFGGDATYVIKVVFLDPPYQESADDKPDRSVMKLSETSENDVMDDASTDDMDETMIAFDADDEWIEVTATIKDKNNHLLGNGRVNFKVEYADGSVLKSGAEMSYTDRVSVTLQDMMGQGTAKLRLEEFATGDDAGAVKVTVSGMYSGSTGSLDLEPITIGRSGPLDMVYATACAIDDKNKDKGDGCGRGYKPMNRYNPPDGDDETAVDSTIYLHLKSVDSLGTKLMDDDNLNYTVEAATAEQWWDSLDCPAMNAAVDPMDDEPQVGSDDPMADPASPYCAMYDGLSDAAETVVDRAFAAFGDPDDVFTNLGAIETMTNAAIKLDRGMINIDEDVDAEDLAGKYALLVTAEHDNDEATDVIYIFISGDPENYMITAKGSDDALDEIDEIALNGSRTYILTITDANGNQPVFAEDYKVTISLAGVEGFDTKGLLSGGDEIDGSDIEMGKVEFSVNSPVDLAIDKRAQIRVDVGADRKASQHILFKGRRSSEPQMVANRAPTAVGSIDDVMFTMGEGSQSMTIDVLSKFSDSDDDALTFSAFSSDTSVATVMVDANAGAVTVTAVGAGTATITVRATDGNHGPATQTFMVTVEAMPAPEPDMTLGDAMGLSASSAMAGEAMVMWTPGANATHQWIWASPSDGSMGMWSSQIAGDASSYTFTGLTSGMGYYFIGISCQTMDASTTCSSWTGWSSLVTIR